jgi:hypothetical protein
MPRNWLFYWIPEQVEKSLHYGSLPHAGSSQFSHIAVTDRIWVCGRVDKTRELFLIGFIDVHEKLDAAHAQAAMTARVPGYIIWDAPWHVLAAVGKECQTRSVSLSPVYRKIFFDSTASQRLILEDGHPPAQQLQTMRRLRPESARLLEAMWHDGR